MYFPTYSMNNFFTNPHEIKKEGLAMEYNYSDKNYPGGRTAALHTINNPLCEYVQNKIMTLIYGPQVVKEDDSLRWWASSFFQLIKPEDVQTFDGEIINKGWIHVDPTPLTAIIYLTDNEETGGTKLYKVKNKEYFNNDISLEESNISKSFNIDKNIESETYVNKLKGNYEQYEEIASFKNEFNSLLAFDGATPHRANLNISKDTYRLTLITFFYKVYAPYHPIVELRRAK